MSYYRRARAPGGCYFFTVVTWNRRPLLVQHMDRLREAFRAVRKRRPFEIDAIVVLPDHLHAIWRLPQGDANYSTRWKRIKQEFSKDIPGELNHRHEKRIWQRRFWEHSIRDGPDWENHMTYIYYNPVKHGLVERPMDWPYSSFVYRGEALYPNVSEIPEDMDALAEKVE
uniref:Putative transposase n=1 Tax=Candidatus Kentrum sp. FM TaxID=2126340 RepID=A0A450SA69_9GAMM|nr:MAG: putative transposase [Candidatus Kentron sp. FM]VFJ49370.1 MAG: putative transposase [Candidatus Kentron sp. FM]VFK08273.1 MAG: putative transposase [Candidatus Kentron sp. FM]